MRRIVLAVAALSVATPAIAADWVAFAESGTDESPTTLFYDADSVRNDGRGNVSAWVKSDIPAGLEPRGGRVQALWSIQCQRRLLTIMTEIVYAPDGAVADSIDTPSKEMPIVPGSLGDGLFERICR